MMDKYEEMARKYIEGSGGLFDYFNHELASPLCTPPEVEGARWILKCLTNPENAADLATLNNQAKLRLDKDRKGE